VGTVTEAENDFQVHSVIHDDLDPLSDNDGDGFKTGDTESQEGSQEESQEQTPNPPPDSDTQTVSRNARNDVIEKKPLGEIPLKFTAEQAQIDNEILSSSTEIQEEVPTEEGTVEIAEPRSCIEAAPHTGAKPLSRWKKVVVRY
jgi:hypothetical protein